MKNESPAPGTIAPDDFRRIRRLFEAALDRPAEARREFIVQACAGDTFLLAEVERMLMAEAEHGGLLDGGAAVADPRTPHDARAACASCHAALAGADRFCRTCGTPTQAIDGGEGRFRAGALFATRFRIVARVGHGGMGDVYRADDLELGQPVALKFLTAFRSDERARARLRNEVRLARQLAHPNICRVYDIGEAHGDLYLSMEYVDGEDLAALLKRIGRLPIDKGIEIARKLCAGLAAAHAKGVLHRDFKPANIMIDGHGEVRIMDFGLAAVADQLDASDVRSGTPAYMAPEQLAGKEATKQSDLYALGLVLFELFTGKPAFAAKDLQELQRLREGTPATTPSTLIPEISPRVERAILRCLEPDAKLRPASALEVSASLPGGDPLAEALAAGETPSPETVAAAGPTEGLQPRTALKLLAWIAASLIAVVLVTPRVQMLTMLRLDNPPETLIVRARDVIRALGYPNAPVDSAAGFQNDEGYVEYHRKTIAGPRESKRQQWARILRLDPSSVSFWYRESLVPLVVERSASNANVPRVTLNDPPGELPGMMTVVLDLGGHVQRLTATPDLTVPVDRADAIPDWSVLFTAAGLDPARFSTASPESASSVISDTREAWTGVFPDRQDLPVRVEAASFRGRVTSFEVRFPWTTPDRSRDSSREPIPLVTSILALAMITAVGLVARHNVISERSDTRGAYRLGVLFGAAMMVIWVLGAHHGTTTWALTDLLLSYVPRVVFNGVISALIYLAIEPWVRRYWPETMITWSRALAGRWQDPVVARDVLFGIALGTLCTLLQRMPPLIVMWFGGPPAPASLIYSPVGFGLEKLMGGRILAADMSSYVLQGYATAMQIFFVLFLFRLLLRRPRLGAVASFAFFTALNGTAYAQAIGPLSFLYIGFITAFSLFVAMKYGVLATWVFVTMAMFTDGSLLTTNVGAWYGQSSLVAVCVVAILSVWAFRTSLGGRPLLASHPLKQ